MYRLGVTQDYLIECNEQFNLQDADIVFFHSQMYYWEREQADNIICKVNKIPNRKFVSVFIDSADGLRTPGYRKGAQSCDIVLKSHYNEKYRYPSNFRPWQFGLTNRILNAVNPTPWNERKSSILVNFRAKHQLRDYMNSLLHPAIEKYMYWDTSITSFQIENTEKNRNLSDFDVLMWKQTGGRHNPEYYEKLSITKMCACYGGVFALPWGNYNKYTAKATRKINDIVKLAKWDRVRQWDSWRLWEAWAAGCCVVHIDFEEYGCKLPVMPENGTHYIGVDIKDMSKIETFIQESENIAEKGRAFVLEHYTPKAIARRLLRMVNLQK